MGGKVSHFVVLFIHFLLFFFGGFFGREWGGIYCIFFLHLRGQEGIRMDGWMDTKLFAKGVQGVSWAWLSIGMIRYDTISYLEDGWLAGWLAGWLGSRRCAALRCVGLIYQWY